MRKIFASMHANQIVHTAESITHLICHNVWLYDTLANFQSAKEHAAKPRAKPPTSSCTTNNVSVI